MQSRRGVVVSVFAAVVGIFIVILAASSHHASDASLIRNFKNHEAEFQNLAVMAIQDHHIVMIQDSVALLFREGMASPYVHLEKGKSWPASEVELNFSQSRWKDYLDAFRRLGLRGGMERKTDLPDAVFFVASVEVSELDNDESAVIRKGYAYVPGKLENNLKNNLDDVKVDRPAIFYKKIQDQWYLYYRWSLSKPE